MNTKVITSYKINCNMRIDTRLQNPNSSYEPELYNNELQPNPEPDLLSWFYIYRRQVIV